MNLLKRLKFAVAYDFDSAFIVHTPPEQYGYRFLSYKEAKAYSDSQIQYRPKIMMAIQAAKSKSGDN